MRMSRAGASFFVNTTGPQAVIAECDENLCGTNLSKAERALFTVKRKEAYIALHPETKNGGDRKKIANFAI
jgi:hypothetical protein